MYSENTASILVVVVALSMMVTPLLLMLHDRVIAPRYRNGDTWHIPTLLYICNEGVDLWRQGTQFAPLTVGTARFTLHA